MTIIGQMRVVVVGVDWDAANRGKCQEHGVSLAEIEALLGANPRVAPSRWGFLTEDRFIAVGRTAGGRPLFVAFTIRVKGGRPLIRPISARYMHKKEIEAYEKEGS
jgi:uncharacterized protein